MHANGAHLWSRHRGLSFNLSSLAEAYPFEVKPAPNQADAVSPGLMRAYPPAQVA